MKGLTRELIALRVAKELRDGMYVNLGIGLPTMIPLFIPEEIEVVFQSENGLLGYGPVIEDEKLQDRDLVNAGAQPVSLLPGASFFHSSDSFAMIRGGHIDLAILGAYQVSGKGDLANWATSYERMVGIGGAMDLACGAKQIWVVMEHTTKSGEPKIVKECLYPLTAKEVVTLIFTNLALLEVGGTELILKELAPGVTEREVTGATEVAIEIGKDLKEMEL